MINIESGMRIFHDGQLVDEKTPGYNTYIIDGIEYDIHPVVGIVVFLDGLDLNQMLTAKFNMNIIARNKHNNIKLTSGVCGTSQYVLLDYQNNNQDSTIVHGINISKVTKYKSPFTWVIYDLDTLDNSPVNIPELVKYSPDIESDTLLSLSTIIYDPNDFYIVPHGYRSPDYPSVEIMKMYKEGFLCKEKINICSISGVLPSITNSKTSISSNYGTVLHKIHWLDWDDIDLYENLNSSIEPLDFLSINKVDTLTKKTNRKWKCFFSGVDIAEDCYVVDIYKQTIGKKTFIYDKPQQLLVSPHLFDFDKLESKLNKICEFILYRTFCPVTMEQLINKMNIDPLHKKILHAVNAGFTTTSKFTSEIMVDNKKCVLYNVSIKLSYLYKERNSGVIFSTVKTM